MRVGLQNLPEQEQVERRGAGISFQARSVQCVLKVAMRGCPCLDKGSSFQTVDMEALARRDDTAGSW